MKNSMQTVTNEQIYGRWEQIPETLREAFFSPENGEIIVKACEDAGLSEEVSDAVLTVAGNILFGFTPISELAKELQAIPGMNAQAVDPIIFQMEKRIFAPIKVDIINLYKSMAGNGPRIIAEAPAEPMQEGPLDTSRITVETAPAMMAAEAPVSPVTKSATEVDIRRVRIGEAPQAPAAGSAGGGANAAAPIEAPTMIHSEAELKPVAQKRRAFSAFGGMFGFGKTAEQKKASSAVTAEVSMVEGLGVRPQEMAKTEQAAPRVVHYTSAEVTGDIFGAPAQEQKEKVAFVPIAKQEHVVDFEPKMVDLAHAEPVAGSESERGSVQPMSAPVIPAAPQAVAPETPSMPVPPAVETIPVVVMKTPQRMETMASPAPEREPRLAEIPVKADVIDLRMLERQGEGVPVPVERPADIK